MIEETEEAPEAHTPPALPAARDPPEGWDHGKESADATPAMLKSLRRMPGR